MPKQEEELTKAVFQLGLCSRVESLHTGLLEAGKTTETWKPRLVLLKIKIKYCLSYLFKNLQIVISIRQDDVYNMISVKQTGSLNKYVTEVKPCRLDFHNLGRSRCGGLPENINVCLKFQADSAFLACFN